ncbi:hypothetical protein BOX15_Mlig018054g1 [Macrostomum lignano]|uniref:Cadherin domain-containing protein n=1 Tax=Macrostomum lignano TaxID=282301 RepID=A0A267DMN9_9PLAT|nr:hypothetical protein BOX15_Mlig018054g1 [Macrostomum lignano]
MRPPQPLGLIKSGSDVALLFILLSLGRPSPVRTAADVAFSVAEETPSQASIGNLLKSLGGGGGTFRIVPQSPYFTVDKDGHVRVSRPIDREDPAACPGSPPCVVEFNAFRGADRVLVRITVEDINDNEPVFKDAQKVLSIEEGDTRFSHPLDQATDADIGDNGMARKGSYYLTDNGGGAFALDTSIPGFLSLVLNPTSPPVIDYEEQKQYNLTLTACDGGREPRCGHQRLIVQVKDRNDNAPNVTAVRVQDVPETLNIGGLVATIEAHDRDSGSNGRLEFAILDPELANLLDVDRAGRVTLRRPLNAKTRSSYEVGVLVSDGGNPSKRTLAKFSFRVIDANDHEPAINIIPMTDNSDRIVISENVAPAYLALVVVSDDDLGENARVECKLAGSPAERRFFQLDGSDKGGYTLKLVVAVDYEERRKISVRIDCRDFGQPMQNSSQNVPVFIRGVNEFEPQFSVTNYFNAMKETYGNSGNNIGESVFSLMATDRDRDDSLTFELQDAAAMALFEVRTEASLFDEGLAATVGQAQLRVRSTVDRDTMDPSTGDLMQFVVVLRDAQGFNGTQHSASVTLTLSVIDVNDNPPIIQPPLVFRLRENCPMETPALSWPTGANRLAHRDPDQGINADVFYRLLSVVGRRPPVKDYLDSRRSLLDPEVAFSDPNQWPISLSENGVISSRGHLDRETYESFALTVMAYNRAAPQPLNSTAHITVELVDENDNDPEWVFPSNTDFVVNYTFSSDLVEVTRVEARDRDSLSNVTYSLAGGSGGVSRWTGCPAG